jgi:hypothetical protein
VLQMPTSWYDSCTSLADHCGVAVSCRDRPVRRLKGVRPGTFPADRPIISSKGGESMTRLFKGTLGSWKKSTLTVFTVGLVLTVALFSSCNLPRMDFAFEKDGSGDGGRQGGGGSGDGTAQVTVEWDPNIEPDIDGYKLYYGTSGGIYDYMVDVGNSTTCTVINLDKGETYFFAATAYTESGTESSFSNELSYSIPM